MCFVGIKYLEQMLCAYNFGFDSDRRGKIYFFISCFPGCLMRDESEVGEENNVKDDDGDD